MSITDDLKKEKAQIDSGKKDEKPAKKKKRTSRSVVWNKPDDVIAYFLHRVKASKFLLENYAQKRSISASAMTKRVKAYADHRDPRARLKLPTEVLDISKEFSSKSDMELEQLVISILRGESSLS